MVFRETTEAGVAGRRCILSGVLEKPPGQKPRGFFNIDWDGFEPQVRAERLIALGMRAERAQMMVRSEVIRAG